MTKQPEQSDLDWLEEWVDHKRDCFRRNEYSVQQRTCGLTEARERIGRVKEEIARLNDMTGKLFIQRTAEEAANRALRHRVEELTKRGCGGFFVESLGVYRSCKTGDLCPACSSPADAEGGGG